MSNRFNQFAALHRQQEPLLIGNAWNAQSAKVLEQEGFKVIGTSSAAVVESLGFADGEEMGMALYLTIIERIVRSVSAIVTVDLEGGYGKTDKEILDNMKTLYQLGVSGINIEDSTIVNGQRQLLDAGTFAERLANICSALKQERIAMFVNVRSDSFLLGIPGPLEDALTRIDAYQATGIHGLFFPCITNLDDIAAVVKRSALPVNVMCVPGLPDFKTLESAGVKRISIGPFLNIHLYNQLSTIIKRMTANGSFNTLFN